MNTCFFDLTNLFIKKYEEQKCRDKQLNRSISSNIKIHPSEVDFYIKNDYG